MYINQLLLILKRNYPFSYSEHLSSRKRKRMGTCVKRVKLLCFIDTLHSIKIIHFLGILKK